MSAHCHTLSLLWPLFCFMQWCKDRKTEYHYCTVYQHGDKNNCNSFYILTWSIYQDLFYIQVDCCLFSPTLQTLNAHRLFPWLMFKQAVSFRIFPFHISKWCCDTDRCKTRHEKRSGHFQRRWRILPQLLLWIELAIILSIRSNERREYSVGLVLHSFSAN